MQTRLENKLKTHPCFSKEGCGYGRLHIPIAPKCNIQCNYCNRKYDCANESRPGVTSEIVVPEKLVDYIRKRKGSYQISTIGIAGPGDPMANWEAVEKSCKICRDTFPEVNLCLSTNGLELEKHVNDLIALGVRFVTVTINAVDMEVAQKIYSHIMIEGQKCTGKEACEYLYEKQLKALEKMKEADLYVKINTVAVKGINDHQILKISELGKQYNCYVHNIIPMLPIEKTVFENHPTHSKEEICNIRESAKKNINVMSHCQRCRADAVGYLK